MNRMSAVAVLLAAGSVLGFTGPADERILWYFDAETALRTAERSGRPLVVLKVRADVGPDVKT
jgi:hypothetical protein